MLPGCEPSRPGASGCRNGTGPKVNGIRHLLSGVGQTADMAGPRNTTRRHPSAGNVTARPALVAPGATPVALPPCSFPHGDESGPPAIRLGPDLDNENLSRLLGPLEGRRVLELGCGAGSAAVAMATAGARVTAVDSSTARLTRARTAAEMAEVRIEFHHGEPADLAFVRADSIDAVLAVYSLGAVEDLPRVFRQLHRVLTTGGPLLIALAHPLSLMVDWDPEETPTPWISRPFSSPGSVAWSVAGEEYLTHVHQTSTVFTALQRSNFRVDTLLEPEPVVSDQDSRSPHRSPTDSWVPPTLVMRARKEGI